MNSGLRVAFILHSICVRVEPTGCVVTDKWDERWQRVKVTGRRLREPVFHWFRLDTTRADIAAQLENEAWNAAPPYERPIGDSEFSALMHREVVPCHGAIDTPEAFDV